MPIVHYKCHYCCYWTRSDHYATKPRGADVCISVCGQEFVKLLKLQPGECVLDVGAGIGGGDLYMAQVRNLSSSRIATHCNLRRVLVR